MPAIVHVEEARAAVRAAVDAAQAGAVVDASCEPMAAEARDSRYGCMGEAALILFWRPRDLARGSAELSARHALVWVGGAVVSLRATRELRDVCSLDRRQRAEVCVDGRT
jgi:hypothetical protein